MYYSTPDLPTPDGHSPLRWGVQQEHAPHAAISGAHALDTNQGACKARQPELKTCEFQGRKKVVPAACEFQNPKSIHANVSSTDQSMRISVLSRLSLVSF